MGTRQFGDESRFAIEVGEVVGADGGSRRVDVWAAGRRLTRVDNNANVPFFAGLLQCAVGDLLADLHARRRPVPYPALSPAENYLRLRADEESGDGGRGAYRFMHWGPTTDDIGAVLFLEVGAALIAFAFVLPWDHEPAEPDRAFVAELPALELAEVLHGAAWELVWDWADRSKWGAG